MPTQDAHALSVLKATAVQRYERVTLKHHMWVEQIEQALCSTAVTYGDYATQRGIWGLSSTLISSCSTAVPSLQQRFVQLLTRILREGSVLSKISAEPATRAARLALEVRG